jgi:hypothetical protein
MRRFLLAVTSGLLLVPLTALAVSYTDVPKNSRYIDAITALSDAGVLTGNPDGTFRPLYPTTRAAILTMSYRAAKIEPSKTSSMTFSDVPADSWFGPYVYDAAAEKFVRGYTDGTFRPSAMVTVAEALKIMMEVLRIPAPKITAEDVNILPFTISPYAWYAPYVVEATRLKVLPLPDQGIEFYLNDPLERQQAAELLYRLWKVWQAREGVSEEEKTETSASSISSVSTETSNNTTIVSDQPAGPDIRSIKFPFKDQWQFSAKQAMVYRFSLTANTVTDIHAILRNEQKGTISCRLYRLQDDGISLEYYVGVESGQGCHILAAVSPGNYQLELNPSVENAAFSVSAAEGVGDGNDGMSQAQMLLAGQIRQGLLAANDLEDWFKFSVTTTNESGAPFMLSTTADGDLGCEIQPGADVNVFGFANPVCNLSSLFTHGTYYVRLKHLPPTAGKRTYTIMLKAQ